MIEHQRLVLSVSGLIPGPLTIAVTASPTPHTVTVGLPHRSKNGAPIFLGGPMSEKSQADAIRARLRAIVAKYRAEWLAKKAQCKS